MQQWIAISILVLGCFVTPVRSFLAAPRSFTKSKHLMQLFSPPHGMTTTDVHGRSYDIDVNEELKKSFISYAMSTILGRALPDVRDGLKPVHRRVLYAMHGLGLGPSSTHRKCARIVGEVLGKYHPHGDQSVYDALVRLAQDFVTNHPLISGHGNFGSIDNDPPAAMRYTEAKLSSLAQDVLFADIKDSTVDWCQNFDGNEMEPLILPARLPLLLINGASGIAVGMATSIPPHNLGEVIDGLVAFIRNPNITNDELLHFIPSPDFPTGGIIHGTVGFHNFAKSGHGSIIVRAKMDLESIVTLPSKSGKTSLVITELPYGSNKAAILNKIAELVNDKKLEGIADLRDESDRNGVRIVIELKKDALPQIVQNNLWKYTPLETSFPGNLLALSHDGTHPDRLTLKCVIGHFVKFRFDVIRRRTSFHLESLKKRDHIVLGLMAAIKKIDDVVKLIKESDCVATAKTQLKGLKYNFSEDQAESILGLTLRRITSLEGEKLEVEHKALQENINSLENLLIDDERIFEVMINESLALKEKYAVPRRSQIIEQTVGLSTEDLVPNERSAIIITNNGYIKRIPLSLFESQARGGRGKDCGKLSKNEETVAHFITCRDHDSLVFITENGMGYQVRAYDIPLGNRLSKGVPLPTLAPLNGASISAAFALEKGCSGDDLVLLTERGFTKKTNLANFYNTNSRGLRMLSLGTGDKLKWVRRCKAADDIIIATRNGYAIRFNENSFRRSSRYSKGVRALSLRTSDSIVDMDIISKMSPSQNSTNKDNLFLLAVTKLGYGKKIPSSSIKSQSRLGKGSKIIKFKSVRQGDQLAAARVCCDPQQVVISTRKGVVIRQMVKNIPHQSKTATGVILQAMDHDDQVFGVDIVEEAVDE